MAESLRRTDLEIDSHYKYHWGRRNGENPSFSGCVQ